MVAVIIIIIIIIIVMTSRNLCDYLLKQNKCDIFNF